MDEQKFTPEESLLLISRTIEETKQRFQENGHIIVLWGSLIFLVFFSQFVLELLGLHKKFDIIWTCVLFPLGAIYTYFYIRRKIRKNNTPKTVLGITIESMGWVAGMNLMVLGFFFSDHLGKALAPVMLILLAMFIIVIGISIKFKPITIGGILLNLLGFCTFLFDPKYYGFCLMLGAVVGLIIPGIILNRANRKEYV